MAKKIVRIGIMSFEDYRQRIADNPKVRVFLDSEILAIDGYVGNYVTSIRNSKSENVDDYEHGVIVITTGAKETEPKEYLFEDDRVISQLDLEDVFLAAFLGAHDLNPSPNFSLKAISSSGFLGLGFGLSSG